MIAHVKAIWVILKTNMASNEGDPLYVGQAEKWKAMVDAGEVSQEQLEDFKNRILTLTEAEILEMWTKVCKVMDYYEMASDTEQFCGVESNLPTGYSPMNRNWEYDEKAIEAPDGTWIGYTLYYGGGKHGDLPGDQWLETVYEIKLKSKTQRVVVTTDYVFEK